MRILYTIFFSKLKVKNLYRMQNVQINFCVLCVRESQMLHQICNITADLFGQSSAGITN